MKFKNIKLVYLLLMSCLMVLGSCEFNSIYNKNKPMVNGSWHKDSVVVFDVDIKDIDVPYSINVNVQHTNLYPKSNLWLFVSTISPNGKEQRDTVQFLLAENSGEWLGKGMSDVFDIALPFKSNIGFSEAGTYMFKIQQGMRYDQLPDVLEVGLEINKQKITSK